MSGFIEYLEARNASDAKVKATLRRSLSFSPGVFVPAYPYVEPFVRESDHVWRRQVHYLIAGLWAAHWRDGAKRPVISIGKACALHQAATKSASTERRFINILDADSDQLPHRLRQMTALLKEYPIDFDNLLKGLLYWNDDEKRTQNTWARDFYRNVDDLLQDETPPEEESAL